MIGFWCSLIFFGSSRISAEIHGFSLTYHWCSLDVRCFSVEIPRCSLILLAFDKDSFAAYDNDSAVPDNDSGAFDNDSAVPDNDSAA